MSLHTRALQNEIRVLEWTRRQLETGDPGHLRKDAIAHVDAEIAEKRAKLRALQTNPPRL
jgi:hypothetical protein